MFLSKLHVIRPKTLATHLETTTIANHVYFLFYPYFRHYFFPLSRSPFSISILKYLINYILKKNFIQIKLFDLNDNEKCSIISHFEENFLILNHRFPISISLASFIFIFRWLYDLLTTSIETRCSFNNCFFRILPQNTSPVHLVSAHDKAR